MRILPGMVGLIAMASGAALAADGATVPRPAAQSANHRIEEVIVTAPRERVRSTLKEELRYHDEVLAELTDKVIVPPERNPVESAFDFDGNTTKLLKIRF